MDLLLIDEGYSLAVIPDRENIIHCERNMDMVIRYYNEAAGDHIDIAAYPKDNSKALEKL